MPLAQGDIIRVDFDSSRGHEPAHERPALVVSTLDCNLMSSMTVLCPITSTISSFPMHVTLPEDNETHGQVCVEQIKALDLEARPHTVVGRVGQETMGPVLEVIGGMFNI